VNDGEVLESDAQSSKVVQPAERALDDPARLAEAAAVRLTPSGDLGGDAYRVQRASVLVVVVAAISLHESRFRQRSAAPSADGRDCFNQGEELGDVVAVGAREDHRERNALRFSDEMVLRARASAIGGIRSCF